ncbi:cilia- and flagella-associated protein 119-like [Narcine bancroftii]|uniref:cilia- and flagella-associated protein 119-like n=1 Tax=Narcine bancroftii TaxID=1343680 RepID=UPI00383221E6
MMESPLCPGSAAEVETVDMGVEEQEEPVLEEETQVPPREEDLREYVKARVQEEVRDLRTKLDRQLLGSERRLSARIAMLERLGPPSSEKAPKGGQASTKGKR